MLLLIAHLKPPRVIGCCSQHLPLRSRNRNQKHQRLACKLSNKIIDVVESVYVTLPHPGEVYEFRKALFVLHCRSSLSSQLPVGASIPGTWIRGKGTSKLTPGNVGWSPSGVERRVRELAPRPFASFLLPLGALPGPRRRAVFSY